MKSKKNLTFSAPLWSKRSSKFCLLKSLHFMGNSQQEVLDQSHLRATMPFGFEAYTKWHISPKTKWPYLAWTTLFQNSHIDKPSEAPHIYWPNDHSASSWHSMKADNRFQLSDRNWITWTMPYFTLDLKQHLTFTDPNLCHRYKWGKGQNVVTFYLGRFGWQLRTQLFLE